MDAFQAHLESLGFTVDQASFDAAVANADAQGMHATGRYSVLLAMVKGDISVIVEQNNARDDLGDGMTAVVEHPPVAVLSSLKGRVAVNPKDLELVSLLVDELS